MPLRFTHRVLEHLGHANYRPSPVRQVRRDLRIDTEDREVFKDAIEQLTREHLIEIGPDRLVRLPGYPEEVIGRFRRNPRGFGFVLPDTPYRDGDLFIPPGRTGNAISGDRVRARVIRQPGRSKATTGRSPFTGRIVEVLQRGRESFVGVLFRRGGAWFVQGVGGLLLEPVLVRDPGAKGAKAGDQVVIELLGEAGTADGHEGVILRVLGEAGRPDVETEAVIVAHGLPGAFPAPVLKQASSAARSLRRGVAGAREDLTGTFTLTIDPPDAKDFDDAISISRDEEKDQWTLGVHIADVAHFVRPETALDQESRQRGNSVYLPRLVIPMLPEVLSNGVCSLQEGIPRLTKSVFITFGSRGRALDERLAATVISSSKRLTYLEAQALIDDDLTAARKHARTEPAYSPQLIETLRLCERLARILRKRRLRDGMIVLDLPQVELVFDEDGHVTDAVPEDDAFTHTLIEMFMVEANEAVARTFDSLNVPIIRRIHPDPVPGDIEELQMYARGMHLSIPDEPTRRDLQQLLEASRDTPASRAIHFAVLRTLASATYSPALIGHFALASDHYAHFTSPIRRYSDLAVHRVVEAYLDHTENGSRAPGGRQRRLLARSLMDDDRVPDEGRLVDLGRHLTETEKEAEAAERQLREFLVLQFLAEHHIGDEFTGVVTWIKAGGLCVSIDRFLVEGLVREFQMPGPSGRSKRHRVEGRAGRMTTRRAGESCGIGDIVTVQIVRVDPAARHLDLRLTALPERAGAAGAGGRSRRRREQTGVPERPKGKRKGYKQGRRGRRSR